MDKEILDAFRDESCQVLVELSAVVEKLEAPSSKAEFPSADLADFSQKIDRIMGAAKTLAVEEPDHAGLQRIGRLAELCKFMGYKASERKSSELLPLFAAFWGDTIETIESLLASLNDPLKSQEIANSFSSVLQKRLEWLLARVDPSTCPQEQKAEEIKKLIKSLGF